MGREFIPLYKIQLVKDEASLWYENDATANAPSKVVDAMKPIFENADREYMAVFLLNVKMKPIGVHVVSVGSLDSAIVPPMNVFKPAILANAGGIVMIHNHPSDELTPSEQDKALTKKMVMLGKELGIPIHDHIIVGLDCRKYLSLREEGIVEFE